ncbi:MAG: hypothetical protein KRP56_07365 [Candidatus Methanogranum gryphiswaldense]|jgi:hypothetical protein|nr:MAG: hypothetical protein KRP56_07365 [Candidatus Methanogranum sp. U3.2.1]
MKFLTNVEAKMKAATKDPHAKENLFEKRALEMFPEENFELIESSVGTSDPDGKGVEQCKNPDYHFRDKKTNKGFWVECKFRSGAFPDGSIQFCDPRQFKKYKEIMETTGEKVYIMIGFEGKPQSPDKIFCLDLKKSPYEKPLKSVYGPCELKVESFKSLDHLEEQLP